MQRLKRTSVIQSIHALLINRVESFCHIECSIKPFIVIQNIEVLLNRFFRFIFLKWFEIFLVLPNQLLLPDAFFLILKYWLTLLQSISSFFWQMVYFKAFCWFCNLNLESCIYWIYKLELYKNYYKSRISVSWLILILSFFWQVESLLE